ncbi:hypothetical protein GUJ93_ZPchr0011g27401 [Zizania palustris]|uniref:Uncharacterized protein n=1 Tax=Zizania palustris TaxID=103762 RepID=A0A8J5WKY9_ZIZPA|nr:hypothetical protein GUJ93_ZPchr0011g27401 [Zizania palustris]
MEKQPWVESLYVVIPTTPDEAAFLKIHNGALDPTVRSFPNSTDDNGAKPAPQPLIPIVVARQTRRLEDPPQTRPRLLRHRKRGDLDACAAWQRGRETEDGVGERRILGSRSSLHHHRTRLLPKEPSNSSLLKVVGHLWWLGRGGGDFEGAARGDGGFGGGSARAAASSKGVVRPIGGFGGGRWHLQRGSRTPPVVSEGDGGIFRGGPHTPSVALEGACEVTACFEGV